MATINLEKTHGWNERFVALRKKLQDGIKWWAEHQAWPATDEIRVESRERSRF